MRSLWGRTTVALSACALAVGFIATSSAAAGASTHVKPHAISFHCHFTSAQPQLSAGQQRHSGQAGAVRAQLCLRLRPEHQLWQRAGRRADR